MNSVVLLGAHRWGRESVVDYALRCQLRPILILYEDEEIPKPITELIPNENRIFLKNEGDPDIDYIEKRIKQLAGTDWFAFALDDYVCELAARLSHRSSLPCFDPSAAKTTLCKHELRQLWNEYCVGKSRLYPVPYKYIEYADFDLRSQKNSIESSSFRGTGPFIIKPDALDASIGVYALEDFSSFDEKRNAIAADLKEVRCAVKGLGIPVNPSILIEERIPRHPKLHKCSEFSAEFMTLPSCQNGRGIHQLLGITQKFITEQNFIEVGHSFPSESFPDSLKPLVNDSVAYFLDKFRMNYGISHWEFIVTPNDKLALVEAQLRPAGDRIMDVINYATGLNPYLDLLSSVSKRQLPPPERWVVKDRVAAIFFLGSETPVSHITGLDLDKDLTNEIGKTVFIDEDELKKSSIWHGPQSCFSKHISLISFGQNYQEAKQKCEKKLDRITIRSLSQNKEETKHKLKLYC